MPYDYWEAVTHGALLNPTSPLFRNSPRLPPKLQGAIAPHRIVIIAQMCNNEYVLDR